MSDVTHQIARRPKRRGSYCPTQRRCQNLIRSDTQFWVVKPRIDQSGVTGLGTLLSGSYISFTPGKSQSQDVFVVQDIPPIAAIGKSGLRLNLVGKNDRILNASSPVLYENFMVGQVESAHFDPSDQSVHYTIFIQSPQRQTD